MAYDDKERQNPTGAETEATSESPGASYSYNVPRQGGAPLFGVSGPADAPAGPSESGGFSVGGREPGYVAPAYDASKDPGNWYANPPAGATFQKFQPGKETEQGYMARLGEYYASPEGQAYQAAERQKGYDETMKIRAAYGLIDPNYDYGPGYGKGGQEFLARNPNVAVTPFDSLAAGKGAGANSVSQAYQLVTSVDPKMLLRAVNIFSNPATASADPEAAQIYQQLKAFGLPDAVLADIIQRAALTMKTPSGTRTAASVLGVPSATVPTNLLATALRV